MKLLAISVFSLAVSMPALANPLLIGAEDDWYPYAGTVETKPKGMAVDIVTAVFKKAGVDIKLVSMPYARCMAEAKAGKLFGCFNAAGNSTLIPQYLWHAKPLFTARINIYANKDSAEKGLSTKNLEGKTVAVTQDYEYGEAFDHNDKIKKVASKHDVQGFRLLLNKKAEYMVAYEKVADHIFIQHKGEFGDKFKPVGSTAEVGLFIAIAKTAPDAAKTIDKFNQAFDAMMKDGSYKEIEKKWK
jgi:polar amino acid transport system substrate-binding protein